MGRKNQGFRELLPSPNPCACLFGEKRKGGKENWREAIAQMYFSSKKQSLPCLQASPHRNATYVSSDPKVGNYSQAPKLISAGS